MSIEQTGSAVPRRQLGRKLRELRESRSLTVTQTIGALEWSKPRLWRYETGQVPVHPNDVEAMCRLYGADVELTESLKALARETKAKGWWVAYSPMPERFDLFIGMEQASSRIRQYEAEIIPGLLQSRAYAWETIKNGVLKDLPTEEVHKRTEVRMWRQRLLIRRHPKAPNFDVILSEAALLRGFSSEIMVEQLTCLLAFSERPNVTIRVLALAAGVHAAHQGPFLIWDFPRETLARDPEPTTVFIEHTGGSLYFDKPSDVDKFARVWADLEGRALNEGESRKYIAEKVREWSH